MITQEIREQYNLITEINYIILLHINVRTNRRAFDIRKTTGE
jgi:hypothetical protein